MMIHRVIYWLGLVHYCSSRPGKLSEGESLMSSVLARLNFV